MPCRPQAAAADGGGQWDADRDVIASIPARVINVPGGIIPRYRGAHGAYWPPAERRPTFAGVTVHLMDAGIDTGTVLGQAVIESTRRTPWSPTPAPLEAGIPLLLDAVERAIGVAFRACPSLDDAPSRFWHHPGAVAHLVRRLTSGGR